MKNQLVHDFAKYKEKTDQSLEKIMPKKSADPCVLHEAMHYCVFNGGKRIRAAIIYLLGQVFNSDPVLLDKIAVATELLHAASLTHDDLPALDNDSLRRGKIACHKQYNEATAILVGDALIFLAFKLLTESSGNALYQQRQLILINLIADRLGSQGVVGGEYHDIHAECANSNLTTLNRKCWLKTGCLFELAFTAPLLISDIDDQQQWLDSMAKLAEYVGLVFQIKDDLLEVEQTAEVTGKSCDSDRQNDTATHVRVLGVAESRRLLADYYQKSQAIIAGLSGDLTPLAQLVDYLYQRQQ